MKIDNRKWHEKGYAESPEAHLVQSWSDSELVSFLMRTTGKFYDEKALSGTREAAGRKGALNRIAIRELHNLSGKAYAPANYNGRLAANQETK